MLLLRNKDQQQKNPLATFATRGVTRGEEGHNSPGANLLWGRWITAGAPHYSGGRRKVLTISQVLASIQ